MAHELEMFGDTASMAYVGDVPWHGLGKQVLPDLTPEQMLVEAGLDWEVHKVPLFANIKGKQVQTDAEALVRDKDGKILDIVTDTWNPVQNIEAFEFFNEFVSAGDMQMHTAGSLRGGQMVWALAKINDTFELFDGDVTESYLLFANPHKFGKSITVKTTNIRVVCNNTITMSLDEKSSSIVNISHRRKFDANAVKEILGISHSRMEKHKEIAQFLGSKNFKSSEMIEFFNRVFPKTSDKKGQMKSIDSELHSKPAQVAHSILETQPGHEFASGSFWQLINAVSYYTDHLAGKNADTRLDSAWFGSNAKKKIDAINLAVEMAA